MSIEAIEDSEDDLMLLGPHLGSSPRFEDHVDSPRRAAALLLLAAASQSLTDMSIETGSLVVKSSGASVVASSLKMIASLATKIVHHCQGAEMLRIVCLCYLFLLFLDCF